MVTAWWLPLRDSTTSLIQPVWPRSTLQQQKEQQEAEHTQ
jgi:hypothetical protein